MARKLKITPTTYKPVPGTNIEVPAYAVATANELRRQIDNALFQRNAFLITKLKQKLAAEYGLFGGAK